MKEQNPSYLGLFPSVTNIGGLEVSGRLAIDVLSDLASSNCETVQVMFYGKKANPSKYGSLCSTPFEAISFVRSIKAVRHVFVWHLSLLRLVLFLRNKPETITVFLHGIEAWRRHSWLSRRLVRRVSLFLSNSEFTWNRFLEFCPEAAHSQHRIVPLGIGNPFTGIVSLPEERAALMIGRMLRSEDYKGHREVILAWPEVLRRVPDAKLWIAGEGDLRPDLESLSIRLGLEKSIHFKGLVSEEEKERLLLQSRCMIMPSRGEGFGIVYLEAMRLGRPCLVSCADAGREVVNPPEAGLSVDVADASSMADLICQFMSVDLDTWGAWSIAARQRYESCYTAAKFRDRLSSALNFVFV